MNSDQLDLWEAELAALPWGGRSPRSLGRGPRGLTKCPKLLFSRREPQKDDRFFVDPNQYDLFLAAITGRPRYGGAPLLVPFEGGKSG